MVHRVRDHLRERTGLEKALYTLLLAAIVVDGAIIAGAQPDDRYSAQAEASGGQVVEAEPRGEAPAQSAAVSRCADLEIAAVPPEPVTCRSRTATLVISGEDEPLDLGATDARVHAVQLRGNAVTAQLRLRNQTGEPQRVGSAGQSAYLNLRGVRVDAQRGSERTVPPGDAATVDVTFQLRPAQRAALRRAGGQVELGVTPWRSSTDADRLVGVVRVRVR